MTLPILLALLSAVCFGIASAFQHQGANQVRRRFPLHPGLLVDLAHEPWWLAGVVADLVGVTLHAVAVNIGQLSVVQPLLTLGLVVALPLQAFFGRPVSRRALLTAVLIVIGLVVFLAVQPNSETDGVPSLRAWIPGMALAGSVILVAAGVAVLNRGKARAAGLAVTAGAFFASSAALVKTWGALLAAGGFTGLALSWQLWAALGCGLLGALLSQGAFQAGALGLPLAAMMVTDPVVGITLGAAVYGEPLFSGSLAIVQAAALLLTLAGVWRLATAEPDPNSAKAMPAGSRTT